MCTWGDGRVVQAPFVDSSASYSSELAETRKPPWQAKDTHLGLCTQWAGWQPLSQAGHSNARQSWGTGREAGEAHAPGSVQDVLWADQTLVFMFYFYREICGLWIDLHSHVGIN